MKGLKYLKLWLLIGWIQIGFVILLSLIPAPSDLPDLLGVDKLIHFSTYAFVMLWFGQLYVTGMPYNRLGLGIIMMGIILEIIQGKTDFRSMSYLDMTANMLGVSLGWLLAKTRVSESLVYIEKVMVGKNL